VVPPLYSVSASLTCLIETLEDTIQQVLVLQDAVHALGLGILVTMIFFRHAYLDASTQQQTRVRGATILYATI
jgi:hypothetical protein